MDQQRALGQTNQNEGCWGRQHPGNYSETEVKGFREAYEDSLDFFSSTLGDMVPFSEADKTK